AIVSYFGHACVLIQTKDVSIMTDPFVSYEYDSPLRRNTFSDIPEKLDYVLLTHTHNDHTDFETLFQLRHKIGRLVIPRSGTGKLQDPSFRLLLERIGFKHIIELHEMDVIEATGGAWIAAIPFIGEHCDLDIHSKRGYIV